MSNKNRNTNYDVLDKILADADRAEKFGRRDRVSPNGVELTAEELAALDKGIDEIEKYLRS